MQPSSDIKASLTTSKVLNAAISFLGIASFNAYTSNVSKTFEGIVEGINAIGKYPWTNEPIVSCNREPILARELRCLFTSFTNRRFWIVKFWGDAAMISVLRCRSCVCLATHSHFSTKSLISPSAPLNVSFNMSIFSWRFVSKVGSFFSQRRPVF